MEPLGIVNYIIRILSSALCGVTNIFLIILIVKYEYLKTKANCFVVCLAMYDLAMGLLSMPFNSVLDEVRIKNMLHFLLGIAHQ